MTSPDSPIPCNEFAPGTGAGCPSIVLPLSQLIDGDGGMATAVAITTVSWFDWALGVVVPPMFGCALFVALVASALLLLIALSTIGVATVFAATVTVTGVDDAPKFPMSSTAMAAN